jgi:hypothetical protein
VGAARDGGGSPDEGVEPFTTFTYRQQAHKPPCLDSPISFALLDMPETVQSALDVSASPRSLVFSRLLSSDPSGTYHGAKRIQPLASLPLVKVEMCRRASWLWRRRRAEACWWWRRRRTQGQRVNTVLVFTMSFYGSLPTPPSPPPLPHYSFFTNH